MLGRGAFVVALGLSLSGCAYMRAVTFQKDDRSGIDGPHKTSVYVVSRSAPYPATKVSVPHNLNLILSQHQCLPVRPDGSTGAMQTGGVLLGFAAEYLVGMLTDELAARVDALVASSQREYSAKVFIPRSTYENADCILVARHRDEPKKPDGTGGGQKLGLAILLKKEWPCDGAKCGRDAATLRAVHVEMREAAAVTGANMPMAISVGIASKIAYTDKDRIPRVAVLSASAFTIPNIKFGVPMTPSDQAGERSDLLAEPPQNGTAVQLTVSVVESGSGLPNAEKAKAELKAFMKAVGPIIVDRVKGLAGEN